MVDLEKKKKLWVGINKYIVRRIEEQQRKQKQVVPQAIIIPKKEVLVEEPINLEGMTKDQLNDFAAKNGYEAVNTSMNKKTMIAKIIAFLKKK